MRLFLNVPYSEKDEAKALGAKWNAKVKKWYVDKKREEYVRFAKWILNNDDEAFIATNYIYVIEGKHKCWKCGRPTRVIGLGVSEYIHVYGDEDEPQYETSDDFVDTCKELNLAWTDDEDDIPPKLLRYLKENYSVKTGYSKTIGDKCFANHCDCCGALQGNWFLFDEPSSPLSSSAFDDRLIERMRNLKIMRIPIEDDLQLNWSIGFCSNDYAYFEYAKFEELVLSSDPKKKYASYEDLYEII